VVNASASDHVVHAFEDFHARVEPIALAANFLER